MNLRATFKAFTALTSLALILYGLSGYIHASLGWQSSILSEAWKLIALAIGASILYGLAYPRLRGVKKGDVMLALTQKTSAQGIFFDSLLVTALEDGKVEQKIRVQLPNGSLAEGIITAYQGTITPPTIKLTEAEQVSFGENEQQ